MYIIIILLLSKMHDFSSFSLFLLDHVPKLEFEFCGDMSHISWNWLAGRHKCSDSFWKKPNMREPQKFQCHPKCGPIGCERVMDMRWEPKVAEGGLGFRGFLKKERRRSFCHSNSAQRWETKSGMRYLQRRSEARLPAGFLAEPKANPFLKIDHRPIQKMPPIMQQWWIQHCSYKNASANRVVFHLFCSSRNTSSAFEY